MGKSGRRRTTKKGRKCLQGCAHNLEELAVLAQRFEKMRRSKVEAEKALKIKSDFLGTMSHELRTPLHVILSNTALLTEGMCGTMNEEQRRRLKLIERNANDLLRLVQGILDITRLEEARMPVHVEEICVEGILIEVRSEFADLSRNNDVALEVRRNGPIPPMLSDRVKVKEILHNLVSNAVKFTPEGSVKLTVRHLDREDRIEFIVQDTGIGIKEENLPHIFDIFYQVESSNHREFGGTGLGLNIVQRLVRLLQGEIRVESRWGKGSTFRVLLPREIPGSHEESRRSKTLDMPEAIRSEATH